MNADSPRVRPSRLFDVVPALVIAMSLATFGCGPSEEATEETGFEPTVAPTARLEYRIDSLQNENRRLRDQVDAVSAENRRITAKNAELETRQAEPGIAVAPTVAPKPVATAPTAEGKEGYVAALDQFKSRNYQGAIEQFNALLNSSVEEGLVDNCQYWIGESYYALKDYGEAIKHFETVLNAKTSGKKPYAQLMLGHSYAALGNTAAAKEAYNKLVANYPASPLVSKAQARLAKLK